MQHKAHFRLGKRRAISTVVGAFLFIILLMAALGVFVSWMQFQSDFLEVQLEISEKGFDKLREDFSISVNYDSTNSNRLYVNVTNAGSIHTEIVDLLIVNKSLTTQDVTRYDISYRDAFVPLSSTIDVLKNQALYMTDGTYDIKVVSVLGTTKTSSLTVTSGSVDPETLGEILKPDFFAKPAVFMAFPNPFGETSTSNTDQGYFSMIVVNPTNQTMTVTSVSFYAIGEEGGGGKFFKEPQTLTEINPTSGWGVTQKQVWWSNLDNPITIQKYNAYNFTVGASPDQGQSLMQAVPITGSVYSSFGQFVNYGHSTGSHNDNTVIANVYQSPDSTETTPFYVVSGVTENVSRTYYVSVENTATNDNGAEIMANSIILINIPPGFTNITNGTSSSQLDPQSFKGFNDGSTQIPVKLNAAVGPSTKYYYSFSATAPDVDSTTLYVFHILGYGKVIDDDTDELEFGPVAQTVVQVCPSSGC